MAEKRRSFLRSVGASSIVPFALTTSASAARKGELVVRLGSYREPLERQELVEAQKRAVNTFRRKHDLDVNVGIVDFGAVDEPIVGFVFKIDAKGQSRYYLGTASGPEEARRVRRRTQKKKSQFNDSLLDATVQLGRSDEDGVQINTTVDQGWSYVTGGSRDFGECPYGKGVAAVDIYEFTDDPDRNVFAVRHDHSQNPGVNECSSGWYQDEAGIRHDWSSNTFASSYSVADHDPSGRADGSVSTSASLSIADAGISWTYTQPDVTRTDSSTTEDVIMNWIWNSAKGDSTTFELGSEMEADTPPASGDRLLGVLSEGTFWDFQTDAYTYMANPLFYYE